MKKQKYALKEHKHIMLGIGAYLGAVIFLSIICTEVKYSINNITNEDLEKRLDKIESQLNISESNCWEDCYNFFNEVFENKVNEGNSILIIETCKSACQENIKGEEK